MTIVKVIIPWVFVLILSGCSSLSISTKLHEESRGDNNKYLSCDLSHYQNGHDNSGPVNGPEYRDIAKESWRYALISSNAYEDSPLFYINEWYLKERYESGKGFSADVYELRDRSKNVTQIAIAFRGTNFFSIADWLFGNFNIYWEGQYAEARELVETLRKDEKYRSLPIVATGHSLGGGLALHVSLYYNDTNAFVFNTSPRVFAPSSRRNIPNNRRVIISEDKEILSNIISDNPSLNRDDIDAKYDKFDFLDDNIIAEHGMYYLARGLLISAASYGDTKAIRSLENNIGCKLLMHNNSINVDIMDARPINSPYTFLQAM